MRRFATKRRSATDGQLTELGMVTGLPAAPTAMEGIVTTG
jgi:hypothetical protein